MATGSPSQETEAKEREKKAAFHLQPLVRNAQRFLTACCRLKELYAVWLPGWPRPKSPLGLCHLEEKNACSVLPLAKPDGRPRSIQLFPCFKADPSLGAAVLQPNDNSRAAESSPESARRVQDIFQAQQRGHRSTFSSLCCSPQGHEAMRGQARRARAPLGPASPMGAGFRQLGICSQ